MAVSCPAGEGVPDAGMAFPEPWCHGDPEKEVKELYPRGTEAATFHLSPRRKGKARWGAVGRQGKMKRLPIGMWLSIEPF